MNLPNKITLFRVCMIPVFLVIYLAGSLDNGWARIAALVVFAIASASDALDGHIARKRNLITNFGKLMDPLADKLLVAAALVAMTERGVLPGWVTIIIISREFLISGVRMLALEQDIVMAASFWGKIKTITQMAMILFLLAWPFQPERLGTVWSVVYTVLIVASVIISILSAVEYIWVNKKVLVEK